MKKKKSINPLDLVYEQFQQLRERLKTTCDLGEKKILLRRLVNIVGVIQFLLTMKKGP